VGRREWLGGCSGHACRFSVSCECKSKCIQLLLSSTRLALERKPIEDIQHNMGKKNKQNKRRRTDEVDIVLDADGVIPNGFTIDFDDNFGGSARPKSNRNIDGDDEDEDSTQQAPRGGHGSQVLPFALQLPEDHSGEPNDGHEYLYFVRCASTDIFHFSYSNIADKQSFSATHIRLSYIYSA
jgi:hypothetical protein